MGEDKIESKAVCTLFGSILPMDSEISVAERTVNFGKEQVFQRIVQGGYLGEGRDFAKSLVKIALSAKDSGSVEGDHGFAPVATVGGGFERFGVELEGAYRVIVGHQAFGLGVVSPA